jgi:tetratricopeptide (TPR) repeat protein
LGRFEDALKTYRACAALATEGDDVFEAARVRQATCLIRLGRPSEALSLVPSATPVNWHPELLEQLGRCALAIGDFAHGLEWLHTAIAAPFRTWIPAHDPVKTKVRALQHIASALQNADPRRALALLRLAVECAKTGREPQLAEVLAIEQAP